MDRNTLVKWLENYLNTSSFHDSSLNGLQIEGANHITHVAVATDACQATINRAIELNAELLIVHHGLFWGKEQAVTGIHSKRLKAALSNNLSLYASHLPLDAHPEIGNNKVLSDICELKNPTPFGYYKGYAIGWKGQVEPTTLEALSEKLSLSLKTDIRFLAFHNRPITTVGIVSGGGAYSIPEAFEEGLDVLVTGELLHQDYCVAEEAQLCCLIAGHYATETTGVIALGEKIQQTFNLKITFIDHPTGL